MTGNNIPETKLQDSSGGKPKQPVLASKIDEWKAYASIFALVLTPIVVALFGTWATLSTKKEEALLKRTELAIEILKTPPSKNPQLKSLRKWAGETMGFDKDLGTTLEETQLPARNNKLTNSQIVLRQNVLRNAGDAVLGFQTYYRNTDQQAKEQLRPLLDSLLSAYSDFQILVFDSKKKVCSSDLEEVKDISTQIRDALSNTNNVNLEKVQALIKKLESSFTSIN